MLENASRQLILVLLSIIAGLVCIISLKVPLGTDLRGGTQLRYEVPRDILDQIRQKENVSIEQIMVQTISVITDRIDPNGALDPLVTKSGDTGILIELPYFQDKLELKRVLERIANLGKLEMRIVADGDFAKDQVRFNMQAEKARLEAWLKVPDNMQLLREDLRNIRRFNEDVLQGPMQVGNLAWYPRLIRPDPKVESGDRWDAPYTTIPKLQQAAVKAYDDAEYNNGIVPPSVLAKPAKDQFLIELVALNMLERGFFGEDLDPSGVSAGSGRGGGLAVNYAIIGSLHGAYSDWSDTYTGKCSAIVLNGVIKSAPEFLGRIPGSGQITGDFTKAEVDELVKVLRTGSLRIEPVLLSKLSIGPTLGRKSIEAGLLSLLAGSLLVFLFVLWYYRIAGTIACITLLLNVFLLYAAMMFMQATITLPGLGGIVLTLGMAVDANVLIYERIREELSKGKELLQAVRAGFERAMSAILDSNITTFLVGIVLFNVGVGPVRGFAVTLMVGIVTTVFTQFFVTRILFHYALERKLLVDYKPRTLFANLNLDFVKHIKTCVAISSVAILAGLCYAAFVVPREVMLGIDFTGGANLQMVVAQPTTAEAVRDRLRADAQFAAAYPNATVNTVDSETEDSETGDSETGKSETGKSETGKSGTGSAAVGGPTTDGTQFNVRLKLNDSQRDAVDAGRKAWREMRIAIEKAGEPPPAAYEPPYVVELRRIFANDLVKPAFSDAMTTPQAAATNLQFAQVDLHFQQPVDVAKARELAAKSLSRSSIDVIGDESATKSKDLRVQWTTQSSTKPWELFGTAQAALASLKDDAGKQLVLSDPFPEAEEIQGRLVNDLRNAAIGALILAWGLIVLYLRVRFHEYKYGVAAVVALVHDVLVAFVAVVVVNHLGLVHAEINLAMIACFLAIIGYSVNDTIVIFDRIRENVTDNARVGITEPFRTLINRALNQTMSRTLLTSGLTLLVVVAQFVVNWGSESDLESFAFAMIVGMVSGVYSTIYIAAPVLIWMHKDDPTGKADIAATPVTASAANPNAH